jgi:hypothetical protein
MGVAIGVVGAMGVLDAMAAGLACEGCSIDLRGIETVAWQWGVRSSRSLVFGELGVG